MILFLDTSALLKLVLDEDGTEVAIGLWERADLFVASWLAYPEARGALAAAARNRTLTPADLLAARADLDRHWDQLDPIVPAERVCRQAGPLAERHGIRGPDAVHLASALLVAHESLVLATWDRRLGRAAHDAGLRVAPNVR